MMRLVLAPNPIEGIEKYSKNHGNEKILQHNVGDDLTQKHGNIEGATDKP
jgi:hypothetical protein